MGSGKRRLTCSNETLRGLKLNGRRHDALGHGPFLKMKSNVTKPPRSSLNHDICKNPIQKRATARRNGLLSVEIR